METKKCAMLSPVLDNHIAVRFVALLALVLVVAAWEVISPRRRLSMSRALRWSNNCLLSAPNSAVLSLVFPVLVVGAALLAERRHWGLFNRLEVPAWLAGRLLLHAQGLARFFPGVFGLPADANG